MTLIAIIFPWLSFMLRGKFFIGFICLILQITILGWLPAAIWAVMDRSNEKTIKAMEQKFINTNRK